jgi:hypothetical protein
MVTEIIFDITTVIKKSPVSLRLTASYDEIHSRPPSIEFELEVKTVTGASLITAISNLDTSAVSLNITVTDKLTLCLLACAGKALLGPLIECFNTDIIKYLVCLRGKGFTIAADAIACAINCDP